MTEGLGTPVVREESDIQRLLRLLGGLTDDPESVTMLTVEGEPRSKARPRFSKGGHAYTPSKQRFNERVLGLHFRNAFKRPREGNLAVACLFFRSNRNRVDVDNLLKQVLDSANGVCWRDDYQVTAIVGVLDMDRERPRTVVAVAPHVSTLIRSAPVPMTCGQCGVVFTPSNNHRERKFCSLRCAGIAVGHDLRAHVACETCGTLFRRRTYSQRYCGNACRLIGLHAGKTRNVRHCCDCGKALPGNAQRCRTCWIIWRGVQAKAAREAKAGHDE